MKNDKLKSNFPTPEEKALLETLVGKPYKEITLADMDKISPGINNDLYKSSLETIAKFRK